MLDDGGEGQGGEALVSVVLGPAVRGEGWSSSSHLVDSFRPGHDQAGGPVGLGIFKILE